MRDGKGCRRLWRWFRARWCLPLVSPSPSLSC